MRPEARGLTSQTGEPLPGEVGSAFSFGALEESGPDSREALVMVVHCLGHSCRTISRGQSWRFFIPPSTPEVVGEGNAFCGTGKVERGGESHLGASIPQSMGVKGGGSALVLPTSKGYCATSGRLLSLSVFH